VPQRDEYLKVRREKMSSSSPFDNVPGSLCDAVDMTVLTSLEEAQPEGEPDLIVQLIDLYLEDTPRRLVAMSVMLAETDVPALRRAAHGLKGSSATLGALRIARLCEAVEQKCEDNSPEAVALLWDGLQQEFARVRQAFLTERQRRTFAGLEPPRLPAPTCQPTSNEFNRVPTNSKRTPGTPQLC
jgi:HPt (histidine-containing phosphotransfer) domain-containing protein